MSGNPSINDVLLPGYTASQQQIDRNNKFAEILRQQSMTGPQGQMVSGHYVAPNIAQYIAQLYQGYKSGQLQDKADADQAGLSRRMGEQLARGFGVNQAPAQAAPQETTDSTQAAPVEAPQTSARAIAPDEFMGGPSQANTPQFIPQATQQAPQQAPQQPAQPQITGGGNDSFLSLPGTTGAQSLNLYGLDPSAYMAARLKSFEPTDATKMAIAAGMDTKEANRGALAKATYIAPTSLRGQAYVDPQTGKINTLPDAAQPGYMNKFDNATGQWSTAPIEGGLDAVQNSAFSKTAGDRGYKAAGTNTHSGSAPGKQENVPTQFSPIADAQVSAFGAGQKSAQEGLDKKWNTQQSSSKEAQTTVSYLQNIKQLATKAATGPASDKAAYVNGILSLTGLSDRATDATTANDLMKKYSAQIVTRLSQAGMNTDAARSIAESATPGAHMNLQALNEAVDNLTGAANMQTARTNLLSPHAASRNPQAYQQAEVAFDNSATPEVFQYHAIAGTPAGSAFLKQQMAKDPSFTKRVQAIDSMGAFK